MAVFMQRYFAGDGTPTKENQRFRKVVGELSDFPNYDTLVRNGVTILLKKPDPVAPSVFEPGGLVEAPCAHGLAQHPDGRPYRRNGHSWMRSGWIEVTLVQVVIGVFSARARCPVCHGKIMDDPEWPLRKAPPWPKDKSPMGGA